MARIDLEPLSRGPRTSGLTALCLRVAVIASLGALTSGCLQPLYGDRTVTGDSGMRARLASVDVQEIKAPNGSPEARIAVEVRNDLIFALTGGQGLGSTTHQLRVRITTTRLSVIVDINTARPDVENYGINAVYELIESSTGKVVLQSQTFSRVSYDVPGQQQRFARARALRDAENRAAQVISENIRNRLASYFAAGT